MVRPDFGHGEREYEMTLSRIGTGPGRSRDVRSGRWPPRSRRDLPAATAPLPTFLTPSPAVASPYGILSEARFGVLAHGIDEHEFGSVDVNGELLFNQGLSPVGGLGLPDPALPRRAATSTRPDARATSTAASTWQFPIYGRFFGELGFGGDLNDGDTRLVFPKTGNTDIRVGCVANFRESASLGYHLDDHWNLMAFAEHASNAGLCAHNEGITAMGARVGYAF